MYLSKLTIDARSRWFRRDLSNVHQMHATIMSAFPQVDTETPARQRHGVLWRLDSNSGIPVQYIQGHAEPDWSTLPAGHLIRSAQTRSLQPILDAIVPERMLSFRLLANPTRCIRTNKASDDRKRVPIRTHDGQIEWLLRKGEQHGFTIPIGRDGQPDVVPSPAPILIGRKGTGKITIEPVRYDGHLVVADPVACTDAILNGIGRAKAYGCGLLSLAPPRIN